MAYLRPKALFYQEIMMLQQVVQQVLAIISRKNLHYAKIAHNMSVAIGNSKSLFKGINSASGDGFFGKNE